MPNVLEVKDLYFNYGEIKAIQGISLNVGEGEIVTLVGGNGAGKTTTLRSIAGLLGNIASGEVYFMGERIDGLKPHNITSLGLSQCLEGRHIFGNLTVSENLGMGAYIRKDKKVLDDLDYVYSLFPRLKEREKQSARTLSGGEQQMLAVGRALMQKPKLIMMDEPSLGLAPIIIKEIFEIIKKINMDGIPVLLVEQNSRAALKIANRGYVLETGEIVTHGLASNLINDEKVQASYLGKM